MSKVEIVTVNKPVFAVRNAVGFILPYGTEDRAEAERIRAAYEGYQRLLKRP